MEFGLGFLSGIGFWPLLIFLSCTILLFPLVELERTGFALLSVVVGLALAQFAFGYDVIGTITGNPVAVMAWGGFYVLIGIGYSLLRWNQFCSKWRADYDASTPGYDQNSLWNAKPDATYSKNRITAWMMFWPWSAFWWFFSDLILRGYEWIYTRFVTVYTRIAARHLAGVSAPK
jgi:hypothetical protein